MILQIFTLDSGTTIGAGSLWTSNETLLRGATNRGYIRCMIAEGAWYNVADKYLGVRFVNASNDTLNGWLRFSKPR